MAAGNTGIFHFLMTKSSPDISETFKEILPES